MLQLKSEVLQMWLWEWVDEPSFSPLLLISKFGSELIKELTLRTFVFRI